jgi:hypothetical protein
MLLNAGICLQDDIFEWHFVVRGPSDTEFEVRGLCMSCRVARQTLEPAATPPFAAAGVTVEFVVHILQLQWSVIFVEHLC